MLSIIIILVTLIITNIVVSIVVVIIVIIVVPFVCLFTFFFFGRIWVPVLVASGKRWCSWNKRIQIFKRESEESLTFKRLLMVV